MIYPVVTLSSGATAYSQMLTSAAQSLIPAAVESRGIATGEEGSLEATLTLLDVASTDAADSWHLERDGSRTNNDQIEAAFAIETLHPALNTLPAAVLGDADFWRFLTFNVLNRLIDAMGTSNRAYLGLVPSSFQDCLPLMMFNRAELSIHHAAALQSQPSQLYCLGTDFWRSHILRVANRYDENLVRALLQRALQGDLPTSIIRLVAPDLKARRATIFLGGLNEEAAAALLDESIRYVTPSE